MPYTELMAITLILKVVTGLCGRVEVFPCIIREHVTYMYMNTARIDINIFNDIMESNFAVIDDKCMNTNRNMITGVMITVMRYNLYFVCSQREPCVRASAFTTQHPNHTITTHVHPGKTKPNRGRVVFSFYVCFIYTQGKLFLSVLCILWCVQITWSIMAWLCRLIGMQWTYEMLVRHILSSVYWISCQLHAINRAVSFQLCVISYAMPCDVVTMIVKIWLFNPIVIFKIEIWIISHRSGFGH